MRYLTTDWAEGTRVETCQLCADGTSSPPTFDSNSILHKLRVASDVTLLEHPRTASTQTDTTGKLTCIITLPSITSSHPSMDITFLSVCPSVGLPLSGMAQKVGDEFSRKVLEGCDMRLAATYSWLDFGGDPYHDADTGIFKRNFCHSGIEQF